MKVKGSVTVFASVILSVMIAFSAIMVDLSRLHFGRKHAQAAVQLSVQSALTQYNAPLKEHYGLMAAGHKQEELETLITDLLEKNLAVENQYMPGYTDLFGFDVKKVQVTPIFNLTEYYVLEQQITQFMKYRAPVNTITNFVEKLKALNTFMAQSGLLNKKMNLEKKLQKIREEQVYLSLLLTERISGFTSGKKPGKEVKINLDSIKAHLENIQKAEENGGVLDKSWNRIPLSIKNISEQKSQIATLEKDISELESKISSLESDLADVDQFVSRINREITSKKSEIKEKQKRIEEEFEKLKTEVNSCLVVLTEVQSDAFSIQNSYNDVRDIIKKHIKYHREALKLINEILKGCKQIQELTSDINSEISDQSETSDNAFLVRIKTDVKKLVLNADPNVVMSIKGDLEENLNILQALENTAEASCKQMADILKTLDVFIDKTMKIPDSCSVFPREIFNTMIKDSYTDLFDAINSNVTGYKKAQYSIEPGINQKERNEFLRWCNRVFAEENQTDTSRDKGQQKKVKQNMEKTDRENRENKNNFNGSDIDMSDEELNALFSSLPSYRNKEGVYPNIVYTENITCPEEANTLLTEEQREFNDIEDNYENSLDQNGNFAKKIKEFLSSAGEGFIKSLYVNEFIVTAFKNANSQGHFGSIVQMKGGPGKTFYEKAEVEYILFGAKKEKTNANLAQASIFGIRMGLNLVHVYVNPDKKAMAVALATSIAGWTGFGVPIVQNLILIGWAAGESWLDVRKINEGEDVAIYKTSETWQLDLKSLFTGIADEIIDETSGWLRDRADDLIDKGEKELQNTVRDIIASTVHQAFLPLEETITDIGEATDTGFEPDVSGLTEPGSISDTDDLKAWITQSANKQFNKLKQDASEWTLVKLEDCKKKIIDQIQNILFESAAYKSFVYQIKNSIDNMIGLGAGQLSDAVNELDGKISDTGIKEQFVGSIVSFDYVDYLRLLLFVVPQRIKLLRCADIITLNMQKTIGNKDFNLSGYNSFIIVEVDITMNFMFIPKFFSRENEGQIHIRWGYGY